MSEDSLPKRLTFLFLSVLAAANLFLITYIVAAPKSKNMTLSQLLSMPSSLRSFPKHIVGSFGHDSDPHGSQTSKTSDRIIHTSAQVSGRVALSIGRGLGAFGDGVANTTGDALYSLTRVPGRVAKFAAYAVNINTYIKPADYTHLPEITPMATITPIAVTRAAAPPAAAVTATPAPAPHVTPYQTGSVSDSGADSSAVSAADAMYAWGNCTRWAAERRAETGNPIPGTWGNAATWADRAAADGYAVDHHPTPGAIMQTADSAGGLGHVAFVESVDSDGTWHISEMNVLGLDVVDHRSMPLSTSADYNFIHEKG